MFSDVCPLCGCDVGPYEWGWSYLPLEDTDQIVSIQTCDVCAEQNNLGDLEW